MFTIQEAHEILNNYDSDLVMNLKQIAADNLLSLYTKLENTLSTEELIHLNAEIIAYSKIRKRAEQIQSDYEIALEILEREDE